jgi:3-hydroxyisobutyrate dehydrogenase-like beta-hydroxyacid dehydrogenase
MTRCGVLGTGAVGLGMVESLVRAGYSVSAFDLDGPALTAAVELGADAAASPGELAERSDYVLLALPDTPEILDAAAALEGRLLAGSVVLLMSTVAPETPLELARRFAPAGVEVLDAPISGGPVTARAGELAIMVGGSPAAYERARPLLEALGSSVVHVGPLGHGEIAKLVNNLMGVEIVVAIAEGLTLAAKAGLDVERLCEAVAGGSGASWILREWIPDTVFKGDYRRRFSLDLMRKDLRLIADLAARLEVPVESLEGATAAIQGAIDAGYGGSDFSILVALAAQAAGTELPGGPPPPPGAA